MRDGRTEACIFIYGWSEGYLVARTGPCMDGLTDGHANGRTEGWMANCMERWMDGRTDGRMVGCLADQSDEWSNGQSVMEGCNTK